MMLSTQNLNGCFKFYSLFFLFCGVNLIGMFLNHIDDTDETHGYWEPLHYLLYGKGLQTWEYSPEFSIRTYSFIIPVYLYSYILKSIGLCGKIHMFYSIRLFFSLVTSFSETKFLLSINSKFGNDFFLFNILFVLLSPGIFLCSSSYLPSAVCMNLIMLSYSAMMDGFSNLSIMYGSIAVLCSGWPFVALLLIPVGVKLIISTLYNHKYASSLTALRSLIIHGVVIILLVLVPTSLVDFLFYQKW